MFFEVSMLQCQAVSKTNGGFSDDIASSMHHAGVVTATDAGVPPPQAVMIVMATYMAWHVLRFFRDVSLRRPVFVGSGGRLCTRFLGSQVHADGPGPGSQVHADGSGQGLEG